MEKKYESIIFCGFHIFYLSKLLTLILITNKKTLALSFYECFLFSLERAPESCLTCR
jgi:hypothetical protein